MKKTTALFHRNKSKILLGALQDSSKNYILDSDGNYIIIRKEI